MEALKTVPAPRSRPNEPTTPTCLAVLRQLAQHWERRAELKKPVLDPYALFDPDKDDFLPELLPFNAHPDFVAAPEPLRKRALSCGWIAYNEKTVDIESHIISPACLDIIYGKLPGSREESLRWIASETLTDEAFHVLLVVNTCRATRRMRDLNDLRLPSFDLVTYMQAEIDAADHIWQKQLITLATATVSEVFVSDYLSLLADSDAIQPVNRQTTAAHRQDELAHSSIFKNLIKYLYPMLDDKQKRYFATVLPKPVRWFASQELTVWEHMLRQIHFPNAERIISDCRAQADVALGRVDYSELITLAQDTGILESTAGAESFARAELV